MKKYGCENPFGNKEIQEKIKKTNILKYGFEKPSCNDEIKNKIIKSEQEFHKKHPAPIGENSPRWKGGVEYSRVERATHEYLVWRRNVFSRDVYTCQRCGDRNGNGHHVKLCAHHIKIGKIMKIVDMMKTMELLYVKNVTIIFIPFMGKDIILYNN